MDQTSSDDRTRQRHTRSHAELEPAKFAFLEVAGVILVCGCVVGSSWLFGYVEPWTQFLAAVAIAIGSGIAVAFCRPRFPIRIVSPIVFALMLLVVNLFQLVPVSRNVVDALSPESNQIRSEFYVNDATRESVPISLTPAKTRRSIGLGTTCLLTLLTGFACVRSRRRMQMVLWSITISGIALGYLGVLCQILGNGVYGFISAEGGYFGSFGNRNNAAGFFCMALACALFLFHREWNAKAKAKAGRRSDVRVVLAGLSVLQLAAAICVTASRGGILAMLTTVVVYCLVALPRDVKFRNWLVIFVPILIVAPSVFYVQRFGNEAAFWNKIGSLANSEEMQSQFRLQHWRDSIRTGMHFPLLGAGFGSYADVYPLYDSLHHPQVCVHAENLFVETFLESGALGLVSVLGMLSSVLLTGMKLIRVSTAARQVAGLLIALTAGQLVSNCFDFGLLLLGNTLVFSLLLGSVLGRSQNLLPVTAGDLPKRDRARFENSSVPSHFGNARAAQILALLILLPGVPAIFELYNCTRLQRLETGGQINSASGIIDIDAQFLVDRAKRAVDARPDDPEVLLQLADSYVSLIVEARNAESEAGVKETTSRFLWNIHAAALASRSDGLPLPFRNGEPEDAANRELLKRALMTYRRAAEFCGLNPIVHKRIAQLSFVDNDIVAEMSALRRCMSLRAGICRELYAEGAAAIKSADKARAFAAFQKCLKSPSVYEPSILSLVVNHFSTSEIGQLIPADSTRLRNAAVHYQNNPATKELSKQLIARAKMLNPHTQQRAAN